MGENEHPEGASNQRSGKSDRDGSIAPILPPKHERRLIGFDDKIDAMHAPGMAAQEISAFLAEMAANGDAVVQPSA